MKSLAVIFIVLTVFSYGSTADVAKEVRDCSKSPPYYPKTTVNTTKQLTELRALMRREKIAAYIIPSTDAHGTEYVRERDKRRKFISGFSGSAGKAIVTLKESALWTDGRYFLQAPMELDCNWILQKSGQKGVPSRTEWLKQVLKANDTVGIDPFLVNIRSWDIMMPELAKSSINLKEVAKNLVDEVWTDRPKLEKKKVIVQPYTYTGKYWYDKIKDVQNKMKEVNATAHVVQALDSVAWLLNLRGDEILYNPVFFAYVVVKKNEVLFFVDDAKITHQNVQKHLQFGTCTNKPYCITRHDYNDIQNMLEEHSNESDAKLWLSPWDSQALRQNVSEEKVYLQYSPISLMKGKKNKVELKGMRNANLKDSVALAEFFMWTEKQIAAKAKNITELSLGDKMKEFRSKQALYKGLSFPSIIGFGENGAVIHYTASEDTNKNVTDQSTLLVDTGSQYRDGSTDVTRTVHFGTPTARQKYSIGKVRYFKSGGITTYKIEKFYQSALTRVLIGQIELATAVFPHGTYGREIDIFAREALFKNGWNYRHGTGHGIGSYLYIHEGPGRIAPVTAGFPPPYETPLEIGFVLSDEPGYYEPGSFGIRLETAVVVVNASTPNRFNDVDYYTFEPICYFPVQRKLIDESIMTERQIKWLNDYHKETEELVGAELKKQKKSEAYEWLLLQTKPIGGDTTASAVTITWSTSLIITAFIVSQF